MRRTILATLACTLALAVGATPAATTAPTGQIRDPLAPKTSAEGAAIGPLDLVTICTSDLASTLRLYRDGFGLRTSGPLTVDAATREAQRKLWGLPADARWAMHLLDRPGVADTVRIRLLVFETPAPSGRATDDPTEPAPLSLGFPTTDLAALDRSVRQLGFSSLAPMEEGRIPRPDGTSYRIQETIFRGPDRVYAVGVSRLDGMPQLGPVDPATGRGGPAYSAQVVRDSDAVLAFYCDLLGMELRSDREWKSGEGSALGVPAGTAFRLAIVYAPGAASGHLLLMDFRDRSPASSGVAPRPPNRGIAGYTFPVKDLERTAMKLKAAGVATVGGPVTFESPELGRHRAMTVLAPNGVLVELVEGAARSRRQVVGSLPSEAARDREAPRRRVGSMR